MVAYVIVATEEQWDFIRTLPNGAILVSPEAALQYKEKTGKQVPGWVKYDFGGDPDLWIDLVEDIEDYSCAVEAILGDDLDNDEDNERDEQDDTDEDGYTGE